MRLILIDWLRGLAILLMVVFHFCYDLWYFRYLNVDFTSWFWEWFRYLIVTLFFLVSGYSITLANSPQIHWSKFSKRLLQVGIAAVAISLVTRVVFPTSWIYFGILHFFTVAMLLVLPFRNYPRVSLGSGILIFILFNTTSWFNLSPLYNFLKPILHLPKATQDLARFIPWFGMILIGSALAHLAHTQVEKAESFSFLRTGWLSDLLIWSGRRPLSIYLIHQPVLYGLVLASTKISFS